MQTPEYFWLFYKVYCLKTFIVLAAQMDLLKGFAVIDNNYFFG